jgi:hypothetical protein
MARFEACYQQLDHEILCLSNHLTRLKAIRRDEKQDKEGNRRPIYFI